MPQNEMIPRDRGEDPVVYGRFEERESSDDEFLDDLNIVLGDD